MRSPTTTPVIESEPPEFSASGPPQDFKGAVMTGADLLDKLTTMFAERPELRAYPVHILDMESAEIDEHPKSGLLTMVDTDMFSTFQGPVIEDRKSVV